MASEPRRFRCMVNVLPTFVFALVIAACGCVREPCYQLVAVTPASGEALVFDACRGKFVSIPVPLPPKPPAKKDDVNA